jgi:hypothetical protein
MGLPSIEFNSEMQRSWKDTLDNSGITVTKACIPSVLQSSPPEQFFRAERGNEWAHFLVARDRKNGSLHLIAIISQDGCSHKLVKQIFALLDAKYGRSCS